MKHNFEKFCKEYTNIENYEKAKADNFKGWCCHHRLETHNSDGERRLVDISVEELQALRMYYKRPASELIFLPLGEHSALHNKEKYVGEKNPFYGRKHSEETKKKIGAGNKGKKMSEEARKKIGAANKGNTYAKGNKSTKGMRWYNNGKINTVSKECPEGFVPGRLLI